MKQRSPFRSGPGISLLVLLLLTASVAVAQQRAMSLGYDANKHPLVAHEIIVRFNPNIVKAAAVDDRKLQSGKLTTFVQEEACKRLDEATGLAFSELETYKIYYHMTTADTLSVSRTGEIVPVEKVWSSFVVRLPDGRTETEVCAQLQEQFPVVLYAHPNYTFALAQTNPPNIPANDTYYLSTQGSLIPNSQYPNGSISIAQTWRYIVGDPSIKVGVFDTGIDAAHPDLNDGSMTGTVVTGGYDYTSNQPQSTIVDYFGHGTSCAGIIGARRNNAVGIAGIAGGNYKTSPPRPGVQIYDMKILDDGGGIIPMSALVAAISEGASQPVSPNTYGFGLHVMSNSWRVYDSWGIYTPQEVLALKEAIFTAFRNKVVYVAAKGNEGVDTPVVPADLKDEWIISVGASGPDGEYKSASNSDPAPACGYWDAYDSNYGGTIDLMAPGTTALVYTTQSRDMAGGCPLPYRPFNGTSAATPHVAGVAALLLQIKAYTATGTENFAPEDIEQILQRSATDKAPLNRSAPYDAYTGWGLLNAANAFGLVSGQYRLVHDVVSVSSYNTLTTSTTMIPTSPYSSGIISLRNGRSYNVATEQATVTFNPQSLLGYGESVVAVWPRNSSSTLWGPIDPFNAEIEPYPGAQIQPGWTQSSVQVTGFRYRLLNGPNVVPTTPGQMAVTYLVRNPMVLPFKPADASSDAEALPNEVAKATIYPNPGAGAVALTCELAPGQTGATVEFINSITGKVSRKYTFDNLTAGAQALSLNVRELASGFYTYRLTTQGQVKTGRFEKQ